MNFKLLFFALILSATASFCQVVHVKIGEKSAANNEVELVLKNRIQSYQSSTSNPNDNYEPLINSPKSVNYSTNGKKFYVQSLEGGNTLVFDAITKKKIKLIKHEFTTSNQNLFKNGESSVFDYKYNVTKENYNIFIGKPVESCFSHNGKYLWVTYYRRNYDSNASCPSAVAIIDTEKDQIIRVMPTGPLPKMIACSPDNKSIVVTHWGDNTLGIIDISSSNPNEFKYKKHCIIDYQLKMEFGSGHVDRDANCGYCLRGTVFSPDGQFLLVGKMGGSGGIAVLDAITFDLLGTVQGMKSNVRHLVINGDNLFMSSNGPGFVQKCNYRQFLKTRIENEGNEINFSDFQSANV